MNRYILFIFIVIISCIYIYGNQPYDNVYAEDIIHNDSINDTWREELSDIYGISIPAVNLAFNGYYTLKSKNLLQKDSLLIIIDFSNPSTKKRFYLIDVNRQKVIRQSLVAHGKNSGVNIAEEFSNSRHSWKSSLGFYVTGETYEGKHGYSLRLDGMSKGLNDNARKRAIVIHGASYVSKEFIKQHGRLGRSFGCPALPEDEASEIIDLIKDGVCLFIYHPSLIPISQSDLEKLP